jgi:hypothetical protein
MLDVCHAGLSDRATIATNDAGASRLVTNSGASMIVLSASKGQQASYELYRGLKAAVVRESDGQRTPWLSRNLMFGDFDLF